MPTREEVINKIVAILRGNDERRKTQAKDQIVQLMLNHQIALREIPEFEDSKNSSLKSYVGQAILQPQEQQAWDELQRKLNSSSGSIEVNNALNDYLRDWGTHAFAAQHVNEAKKKREQVLESIQRGFRDKEQSEWEKARDSRSMATLADHVSRWRMQGVDTHAVEADHLAWRWCQDAYDKASAMSEYLNAFPAGLHINEAQRFFSDRDEWQRVQSTKELAAINDYVKKHPNSSCIIEARACLQQLKDDLLRQMDTNPENFTPQQMSQYLVDGIFSESELIMAGVASEESIRIVRDYSMARNMLPDLKAVQQTCSTSCEPGRTDVFLFGTPATGKTCILMGLIGSDYMQTNFVKGAGDYAEALNHYLRNGFTPGQTTDGFVATMQATITEDNGSKHLINLVELAGEDFAVNVANAKNGKVTFAEMGNGVSELLANNNRKVFFIIVEPRSKMLPLTIRSRKLDAEGKPVKDEHDQDCYNEKKIIIDQFMSLNKMIDMLADPSNKEIMEKVDAIHIIMTKGDLLSKNEYDRSEKGFELFKKRYRKLVDKLVELCSYYGINQNPDKRLNGVPYLFVFSLGNFFPGGIYSYDSADANLLVETIAACTQSKRGTTPRDRICMAMSRPIL